MEYVDELIADMDCEDCCCDCDDDCDEAEEVEELDRMFSIVN
jgi:hypothetical protein